MTYQDCGRCGGSGTIALQKVPSGKWAMRWDVLAYNYLAANKLEGFDGDEIAGSATVAFACPCAAGGPFESGASYPATASWSTDLLDPDIHRLWERFEYLIPLPDTKGSLVDMVVKAMKQSSNYVESKNVREYVSEYASVRSYPTNLHIAPQPTCLEGEDQPSDDHSWMDGED
jgi:hypothetical protein